jgi:CheY-like chemotaxis protein
MDSNPPAQIVATPDVTTSSRPTRVLLAEDDPEMGDMVAAALRSDGAEVVLVRDGRDLLLRLGSPCSSRRQRRSFDVIVSDLRMPGYTGIQVLEGLRRAGWLIPMIVMTAFGDAPTRARVEAHGGFLFNKPFDLDDLRTAVLHLIGRRSLGDGQSVFPPADDQGSSRQ